VWSVVSTTIPLHWCDQLSVQRTIYTQAVVCQYNIHTRLCSFPFSASRFTSKVLSWTIRYAWKPPFACLFSPLLPVTTLYVIPFLLLFILMSFPSVLSAFVSFILVLYFFLFPCSLFVSSRFLPFSPFDLLVWHVQCVPYIAGLLPIRWATMLLHSDQRCPQFCSVHPRSDTVKKEFPV
jgi:hypothetical protein